MSIEEILKGYESNILSGQFLIDNPKPILSVSPNLNLSFGGGIPDGSIMMISGKPKVGKSSLCLHLSKKAQEKGKNVHYNDIECRLKKRDIEGIQGLDPNKINIIRSAKGNILCAEKHLDIVDKITRDDPGSLIIMDSISQLYAEKQLDGDIGEVGRDPTKIMLSEFCKRLQGTVPINGNIIVMIVHLISNTSGYGNPWNESGGNKIQFAADIKMRCKNIEPWTVGSGEKQRQVGQIVRWQIDTTALNAPPGRICKSYLRYGFGIDECAEIVDTGMELGLITKKGSWYRCEALGDRQFQGQENFTENLRENRTDLIKVMEAIKEMIM